MRNSITLHDNKMPLVEYQGQRVVTFAMIDEVHQRPEGTARKAFNRNGKHFIPGTDFVKVTANEYRAITGHQDEKEMLSVCASVKDTRKKSAEKITEDVTLVFESGYLMIVKPFKDDLSWQIQRELVNGYFRQIPEFPELKQVHIPTDDELQAMPLQQAQNLLCVAENQSYWRHGKKGSASMNMRRRELKRLRPAIDRITSLIQLTIPGLEKAK